MALYFTLAVEYAEMHSILSPVHKVSLQKYIIVLSKHNIPKLQYVAPVDYEILNLSPR